MAYKYCGKDKKIVAKLQQFTKKMLRGAAFSLLFVRANYATRLFNGLGAVGIGATSARIIVVVAPAVVTPAIVVVVRTAHVVEFELYIIAVIVDVTRKAITIQVIVANLQRGALFDEANIDSTIINTPLDVISYIVPGALL